MPSKQDPNRGSKSTSPTKQPSTGLSACASLIDVLFGHVLTGSGNWSLRIRRTGPHGNGRVAFLQDTQALGGVLTELANADSGSSTGVDESEPQ